jgi:hypothetical protein
VDPGWADDQVGPYFSALSRRARHLEVFTWPSAAAVVLNLKMIKPPLRRHEGESDNWWELLLLPNALLQALNA